jgi:phosphoglycerol transferase MdoB-like AlkP superfamily enzyme
LKLYWSFRRAVVFWWILFLVLQQTERLFLLPQALSLETPAPGLLFKTLVIGLRADFITSTLGIVIAVLLAGGLGVIFSAFGRWFAPLKAASPYRLGFFLAAGLVAVLFLILLTVDMVYSYYNQQHLNFVFFEYLSDLFASHNDAGIPSEQAEQQTGAELQDRGRWVWRLSAFAFAEGIAIAAWWFVFRRLQPLLAGYGRAVSPATANTILLVSLVGGMLGFHPQGPYAIRIADINSAVYYTLAQNPILYASEALRATLDSRTLGTRSWVRDDMRIDEALRLSHEAVGNTAMFPDPRYPFVREMAIQQGIRFAKPVNVLLIFVEGLDRRYLDRTVATVRLTPFLDRLKGESVYFENFFANGVQTAHGLFASFCSYYPNQGSPAMKTEYAHDYLCLPTILSRAGYRTEMVTGQHRDLNRLHLFMARNGLHQLFAEDDFPQSAERMGLGITDGALLDGVRSRIEILQASDRPFFLTTLTVNTHHPFTVPLTHPEVRALSVEPDRYLAALRYVDLEMERWFLGLRRDGLLKNTIVFVLGDHGRHEATGRTDFERQAGHFLSPLFIWMDESLRAPEVYRPRVVSSIASQVDLAPTILALNGLTPRISPFLGRDVSCLLITDCAQDNWAFLSSVYDDLIGLADKDGLLLYSLRSSSLSEASLKIEAESVRHAVTNSSVAARFRRLLALYVSSNHVLDYNQIWSWKEKGKRL